MECDRGDSFAFDFEPDGIPLGSKLKGKLSPRSYPIQYERKRKYSFLSVYECRLGVASPAMRKLYSGQNTWGPLFLVTPVHAFYLVCIYA